MSWTTMHLCMLLVFEEAAKCPVWLEWLVGRLILYVSLTFDRS